MSSPRLDQAIAAIDAANAGDPNTLVVDGVERPKEQAHAEMATDWVRRLDPDADEAQILAARAHHLRRWVVPRADFPDGRAGYLRWRTALSRRHADEVAEILATCGYEAPEVERVQQIIRKDGLRTDPAVQTHEDALCLTFLQTQFDELAAKLGDDRTVEVVARTLAKMSERGRAEALALPLSPPQTRLVERALTAG